MNLSLKNIFTIAIILFTPFSLFAQAINIEFRNGHLNEDKTQYLFELWTLRGEGYDVTDLNMSNWVGMNVRSDIEVPNGVTITTPGGTGVTSNFQYCAGGGISINYSPVQGPMGTKQFSINMLRDETQPDIPVDGVKIADCVLTFSGPVNASNKVTVRPYDGTTNTAGWSNLDDSVVRRAIVGPNAQPLPVKLATFNANAEGKQVNLTWSTTEEVNSDHFDVERSKNGKQWTVIKTKKAAGDSKVAQTYQAIDSNPLAGDNLYRLHMIDKDGSSTYSSIRNVKTGQAALSMYPNPVANTLTIDAADFANISKVRILNANGKEVYQSGAKPQDKIDVSKFSAGIYIVSLRNLNGEESSYKIVVTK